MKAIEEMSVYELRERKAELVSELRAVVALLHEHELVDLGLHQANQAMSNGPAVVPRPNAHPEGADMPQDDGA